MCNVSSTNLYRYWAIELAHGYNFLLPCPSLFSCKTLPKTGAWGGIVHFSILIRVEAHPQKNLAHFEVTEMPFTTVEINSYYYYSSVVPNTCHIGVCDITVTADADQSDVAVT